MHVPNAFWPVVGRKREREGSVSQQIKLHLQNAKRIVVRATSKKEMEMKKLSEVKRVRETPELLENRVGNLPEI